MSAHRRGYGAAAAFLGLCLLGSGCATRGTESAGSPTPVEQLQDRIVQLQRKAAMNEVEIARLTQRIAELESGRPAARPAAPPPVIAEAAEPVEGVKAAPSPPPVPRPAIRPSPPAAKPVTGRPALEVTDIDLPPATAPAKPPAKPAPTPVKPQTAKPVPEKAAETPRPAPAPKPPADGEPVAAQALYDRGYTLYHQGRYADAEASFQRFLKADPKSELADNAQYWIGECRYARNDLRGALSAFRDTVEHFPQGNKVPDALLKAAQTLEGLGDVDKARATYDEVIQKFPTTAAAAVAAERKGKLS